MAKVKIQGHASGTGILTVTAPNTSTDRTITLPDADVTLEVNRPFFRAYMSDHQAIATATTTLVAFDEEIDTTVAGTGGDPDSTYNTSTYQWTPAVAGFYFIGWTLYVPSIDDGESVTVTLYKNGGNFGYDNTHGGQIWNQDYSSGYPGSITGCCVVPLDNNDYVSLHLLHNEGATQSIQYWYSHFFGWRIAGA